MNATAADVEDHAAQTSYSDSVLTAMKQVHDTIEQLEVRPVCVTYNARLFQQQPSMQVNVPSFMSNSKFVYATKISS